MRVVIFSKATRGGNSQRRSDRWTLSRITRAGRCTESSGGCITSVPLSPTFGKHVSVELTEDNHLQFFIPRGFAHGFSVLSKEAVFQYKCDSFYAPDCEGAIAWDDPDLGIDWRIPRDKAILSGKDAGHPKLKDIRSPFGFDEPLY